VKNYILKNLGCKANLYDSQLMEQKLQNEGWSPTPYRGTDSEEVELCIINSCTVTDEADRQTRKMAAKLARDYPNAKVVVTGCGAEVDPEGLAKSKGVHYVVGNQNKDQIIPIVLKEFERSSQVQSNITSDILGAPVSENDQTPPEKGKVLGSVSGYQEMISRHPMDREWPAVMDSFQLPPTHLQGFAGKTRAFLKIQEGCDSFCTYCIIPYGRGPSRSLPQTEIIEQIQKLIDQGIREVVITGTNIGDYGTEWGKGPLVTALLAEILQKTRLERLRVSSLDPTEITPGMMRLMEENPRFCAHFHVSLQSPQSKILRLMKRKYGTEEVISCLEKISQISAPVGGVFVGMDVITGFPGETQEDFELGYELLSKLPWNRLHVFPYSERAGTPATRLPNSVPQHLRVQRTKLLNQLSMERQAQKYREILENSKKHNIRLHSVLLEKQGEQGWVGGYTSNYLRVLVPYSPSLERNQEISVTPIDLIIDSKAQDVALVGRV
jgi:threonylcarbamoyladenosine tRNA methylthiotransferase MtaB